MTSASLDSEESKSEDSKSLAIDGGFGDTRRARLRLGICNFFARSRQKIDMQRSYDDLVKAILTESQTSRPAVTVKVESFNELHQLVDAIDKSMLFIVSAEPQQLKGSVRCDAYPESHNNYAFGDCTKENTDDEVCSLDISVLATDLEEYFSWFGEIDRLFLLGTSVAVFKMKHTFSVAHILRCSVHEITVPRSQVRGETSSNASSPHYSILTPMSSGTVKIFFTVNAFTSNSLSLNGILALLKHVDPAAVVMVRRVNRLGFEGAKVIGNYFGKYGKVLRVFMLPLRSRKKSQVLPSKTGFVVMEKPECCNTILASSEHTVALGVTVSVGTFVHKGLSEASYVNEY